MAPRLTGHIAIVALGAEGGEALARRLADEGAGVILVGQDGWRAGRLTAELAGQDGPGVKDRPGRVAVFCPEDRLEDELDALVELVSELSRSGGR